MIRRHFNVLIKVSSLLLVAFLFLICLFLQFKIYATTKFDITDGLIILKEDVSGSITTPTLKRDIHYNKINIVYEYVYKDKKYQSSDITYLIFYRNINYQFLMGQHIKVYLNKNNPKESLLVVGTRMERVDNYIKLSIIMCIEMVLLILLIFFGRYPLIKLLKLH